MHHQTLTIWCDPPEGPPSSEACLPSLSQFSLPRSPISQSPSQNSYGTQSERSDFALDYILSLMEAYRLVWVVLFPQLTWKLLDVKGLLYYFCIPRVLCNIVLSILHLLNTVLSKYISYRHWKIRSFRLWKRPMITRPAKITLKNTDQSRLQSSSVRHLTAQLQQTTSFADNISNKSSATVLRAVVKEEGKRSRDL